MPLLQLPARDGFGGQPLAGIERGKLTVAEGGDKLLMHGDDAINDTHCCCGSLLYSRPGGAFVHVAMGTLVDDPAIRPARHIFVGSKAPWFTTTDDLPRHSEHAL